MTVGRLRIIAATPLRVYDGTRRQRLGKPWSGSCTAIELPPPPLSNRLLCYLFGGLVLGFRGSGIVAGDPLAPRGAQTRGIRGAAALGKLPLFSPRERACSGHG